MKKTLIIVAAAASLISAGAFAAKKNDVELKITGVHVQMTAITKGKANGGLLVMNTDSGDYTFLAEEGTKALSLARAVLGADEVYCADRIVKKNKPTVCGTLSLFID